MAAERLDDGVVLTLGRRAALLLHFVWPATRRPPEFGLVGESDAILEVRRRIERLATRRHSVLLRGETGTGKEIVARALHQFGGRRAGPFRAVNLGAIPPDLAAAELFGALRGAYTGAASGRTGYFQQAHGGTLFLDEVVAAPTDVQSILLRVLERGEIQAVGAGAPATVDVRVVAATDADLEGSVANRSFSAPLLHRLAAHPIHLPPLRHRRDDIGRLLVYFLRAEAEAEGCLDRLETVDPDARPWLGADLMTRLVLYCWPGNVRELKNVASQLVLFNIERSEMKLPPEVEAALGEVEPDPPAGRRLFADVPFRDARSVGRDEISRVMKKHAFEPSRAAEKLGVSRASLYKRLEALGFPTAASLSEQAIRRAAASCDGDLKLMARKLEVSPHGLKMRLKHLDSA